jgi:cellulose biosynthesis protein BcsQ
MAVVAAANPKGGAFKCTLSTSAAGHCASQGQRYGAWAIRTGSCPLR